MRRLYTFDIIFTCFSIYIIIRAKCLICSVPHKRTHMLPHSLSVTIASPHHTTKRLLNRIREFLYFVHDYTCGIVLLYTYVYGWPSPRIVRCEYANVYITWWWPTYYRICIYVSGVYNFRRMRCGSSNIFYFKYIDKIRLLLCTTS